MKIQTEIIHTALKESRTSLYEHEAKALARAAGIIVPKYEIIPAPDETGIISAAERLGFPLALKAVSPDILHKTEAGAVMLDIKDRAALAAAVKQMKSAVPARMPGAVIRYFLIEKIMPPGLELLIGGLRDEQFGPSIAFGLGGIWVEALKDAVFGILPMTRQELLDMIAETRAGMFLKGFRGSPPLDEEAVFSAINAVSKLMTEYPEIKEIDVNPLRLYNKGVAALDVRIVLG